MPEAAEDPCEKLDDFTEASFRAPTLECDIVMKGGITSGVIYPLAVCELAQTYRLRSVGGASAGAIAAAAAAAAEVGRARAAIAAASATTAAAPAGAATADLKAGAQPQLSPGFVGLAGFPGLLSGLQGDGRSLLFHLFRPQPTARRLFALLTAGLDEVSRLRGQAGAKVVSKVARRLLTGVLSRAKRRAVVGVLPGLVLAAVGVVGLVGAMSALAVLPSLLLTVLGLALALVGLVVAALTAVLSDLRQLPGVGFGISSGRGETDADLALTPWLYARLQELAGQPTDQPLTFAHLAAQEVELKVMTTNLSRAQPLAMPWVDETYFYDPVEFRALFGEAVVKAMQDPSPPAGDPKHFRGRPLLPFPPAERLPVIVAARMSLSFPMLISAVPLYTADHTAQSATAEPPMKVNWFSDGGLTANLPVQFFDSPLPTRPTFAINLANFDPDRPKRDGECHNSYLPTVNVGGLQRPVASWEDKAPLSQLLTFGMSLVQTARGWVDEASLVMPGYRDRVVTVFQDPKAGEGGLNLAMPAPLVEGLSLRGRYAARKLVDRFGPAGEGWDNHRWIRFRTATAGLSDWFTAFEHGYAAASPSFYEEVLAGCEPQPSYPLSVNQLVAAKDRVTSLRAEITTWSGPPTDAFTERRPQPQPVLRLVPPGS